jgi:hypothetical protein
MRRRALIIVAAVLGLLALGGIAWASIPGPDGVIHGCYKTGNPAQGSVIVVDSTASCPSGFTALNWNQTGPQGATGATGPSGVAGLHYVFHHVTGPFGGGSSLQVIVNCPAGEQIIWSGGLAEPLQPIVGLDVALDATSTYAVSAYIYFANPSSITYADATALCAPR